MRNFERHLDSFKPQHRLLHNKDTLDRPSAERNTNRLLDDSVFQQTYLVHKVQQEQIFQKEKQIFPFKIINQT